MIILKEIHILCQKIYLYISYFLVLLVPIQEEKKNQTENEIT